MFRPQTRLEHRLYKGTKSLGGEIRPGTCSWLCAGANWGENNAQGPMWVLAEPHPHTPSGAKGKPRRLPLPGAFPFSLHLAPLLRAPLHPGRSSSEPSGLPNTASSAWASSRLWKAARRRSVKALESKEPGSASIWKPFCTYSESSIVSAP